MSTSTDILKTLNSNGSGLNIGELASSLATAETTARITTLKKSIERDSLQLSALSELRSQFDKFGAALVSTASNPVLSVETGSSSIMPSVTDRNKLVEGTTEITVSRLASRQVLEFAGFTSDTATVSGGTLTIEFGEWDTAATTFSPDGARGALTIDVTDGMTLTDVAEALDGLAGVSARVLPKGDGTFSLGIVTESGSKNAMRLTATPGVGAGTIALSDLDNRATNATRQVQAAADAALTVDGINVTRSTNTLTDIVSGMSITLSAVTSSTIEVSRDEGAAKTNMQTLVTALNETVSKIRSLSQRGINDTQAGVLAGDRRLDSLEQDIRRLVAAPIAGFGKDAVHMAELGLSTNRDGTFVLDNNQLEKTFASKPTAFDAAFGDVLASLTEGLSVGGVPDAEFAPGEHQFSINPSGQATLDGRALKGVTLPDGSTSWTVPGGSTGLTITTQSGVSSGVFRYGRSFVAALATLLDKTNSNDGVLGRFEQDIQKTTSASETRIESLEAKAALLERRYLSRFAAMEQAITAMKSTGTYLKNLVDMWTKSN